MENINSKQIEEILLKKNQDILSKLDTGDVEILLRNMRSSSMDLNRLFYNKLNQFVPNVKSIFDKRGTRFTPKADNHFLFIPEDYDSAKIVERTELEANLLDAILRVSDHNSLNYSDVQRLFPAILRMLKSNSDWSK